MKPRARVIPAPNHQEPDRVSIDQGRDVCHHDTDAQHRRKGLHDGHWERPKS
jgi:hypothetical protein